MTFDQELAGLIANYGNESLTSDETKAVEQTLIDLVIREMLSKGDDEKSIKSQYRKMALKCHPDKVEHFSTEILWLEDKLGEGCAFKIVTDTYEKLSSPTLSFSRGEHNAKSLDDLIADYERICKVRTTRFQHYISMQILNLLKNLRTCNGVFTDELKSETLQTVFHLTTLLHYGYLGVVFLPEITLCYVVSNLIHQTGKGIEATNYSALKIAGNGISTTGDGISFLTTSTILQVYNLHLQVVCLPYHSIQYLSHYSSVMLEHIRRLITGQTSHHSSALTLYRSQDKTFVIPTFVTIEIKTVLTPLIDYVESAAQQAGVRFRTGYDKVAIIQTHFHAIRKIDLKDEAVRAKLNQVSEHLEALSNNPVIAQGFKKNALKAVIAAKQQCSAIIEKPDEVPKPTPTPVAS